MVEYLKAIARRPSAERSRYAVQRLQPHFSGQWVDAIGADQIAAYKAARTRSGVGPATIAKELQTFSAAVRYCQHELDWSIPNPAARRAPRKPQGRVRWLTKAEARVLLQKAAERHRAPWLRDFIELALHTGMRPGELLGLEVQRVDLQAGRIYLEPHHQKSQKYGAVDLNGTAAAAIRRRLAFRAEHCPASRWVFCNRKGQRIESVKKSFAATVAAAGLEDFHPHDLRHTFASWLVQAGTDIRTVADLLRHSDIRATMIYAHLAPGHGRPALDLLESD